ncbi:MAG: FIST C-terminal domain-containing protein [Proteobacteria bacterium]|jgi:small ligand-binding sensory domain FIST|nr:FIST C-terminal domain-containing protein [Pseudomonadota bacterium]
MQTFKLGHSHHANWLTAVDECLQQTGSTSDANLGFIYLTDSMAEQLGNILRELKTRTGIMHWVGSVGQAILCTNTEYSDEPALVIMVAGFPDSSFSVFDLAKDSHHPVPEAEAAGLRFAIVHGDPRNGQLPELIEQLPERLGNGYLVGGLTSSNTHYYQIADDIIEGTLSGVVFNDQVQVATGVSQGCSPIGPVHTLTECDHHMAISIDQRPALDVFKEDIGEVLARDIDRAAGYIFAGFPVVGSDTGDYLVRNVIGIDPENNLLAIGDHMTRGAPIMFCRRDSKSAAEDMQRMLSNLKSRLSGPPRGGIYISCVGRGQHLFGESGREMEMISEALGDIPLAGFYANGEIAGQNLYGYTGVLTLFL